MVLDPGQQFAPLNGEYSETVVPVAAGDQELVVGRENKEMRRHGEVLGERSGHGLPPGPAVRESTATHTTKHHLIAHILLA